MAEMQHELAVDVGGSKFAAAVVTVDGDVVLSREVPTPPGDAEQVAAALQRVVRDVWAAADRPELLGVGIGSAGPVDLVAGTVSPVNIPGWRRFPIVQRVRQIFGDVPVVLSGDGVAAALGEQWRGAGAGSRALLGVVVSTGVGGGFVLDGQPYVGVTGNAGHVGHVVVDIGGERCPCGSRGCVETLSSGPAMVRWALAQGWTPQATRADGIALTASAGAGDTVAQAAFERGADALAAGIVNAAALVDLDDVVIGGGMAAAGDVLFGPLGRALHDLAGLDFVRRVRVRPGTLGRAAGLVGAAALVVRR